MFATIPHHTFVGVKTDAMICVHRVLQLTKPLFNANNYALILLVILAILVTATTLSKYLGSYLF